MTFAVSHVPQQTNTVYVETHTEQKLFEFYVIFRRFRQNMVPRGFHQEEFRMSDFQI